MEKVYKPEKHEAKIYQMWEKGGYFTPKRVRGKKPFVITLPPPNVTGKLHLGHAMYVVEDILARYQRMRGKPTLWLPGLDHASIAVHSIIDKQLAEEGKTRHDVGREVFLKRAKTYADESRQHIKNQLKSPGSHLGVNRLVGEDLYLPVHQRENCRFADKALVPLIIRMNGDGGIAEHCFRSSCGHGDKTLGG